MDEALRRGKIDGDTHPLRVWRRLILTLNEVTEDRDEQLWLLQDLFQIQTLLSRKGLYTSEARAFLQLAYPNYTAIDPQFIQFLRARKEHINEQRRHGFDQLQLWG